MTARRWLLLILQIAVSLQENNDVHISPANNPLKVIAGSKFNLTCSTTMTCSTPLIYTWRKPAGVDVNNKVKPSMTFEFHEVETQEEGEYICTVSCSEKKKSKKVRVQVISFNEPVIYVPESLKEGTKVNAACTVENINPNGIQASTVWMLGTQVLRNVSHKPDDHFTDTLTIQPKKANHGQNLTCIVTLDVFQKEHSVELQVNYAPSKTQISVSTPLVEGNDFVMNCSSDGNPRPKLEWLKKNKPWPANMRRHNGSVSGVLSPGDEGTYECTAKNQQGERKANISLVIHYGPKNTSISASPGSDIPEGGSLQLTCKTQSNPEVTQYKWKKLPEASLPQGVLVEGSTLTIHSFQRDHQGIYECEAVHQSGKHDRAYVTVTQEDMLSQEPAFPIIGAVFGSLFGGAAAGGIGGFLLAKLLK
ncbi:vascular cell adhesion protein 1-like [Acipenser oxyrinchus oxyrinchus]|uniref:Vascular cell adhesion protein 1-like n=1 Tax=Acipenser oxyrinchus oxyrinchus TaxID=40147 RepID=A0AAD8G187_ACIOX|nr:vascular cell adhesion protein 1-like [Acipenser oxyrinchus oxyrinchus]